MVKSIKLGSETRLPLSDSGTSNIRNHARLDKESNKKYKSKKDQFNTRSGANLKIRVRPIHRGLRSVAQNIWPKYTVIFG